MKTKSNFLETVPGNIYLLKRHGNEAGFLGFLKKLVPHRSLTIPFELFRLWLQIRNRRLSESASRGVADSLTRRVRKSLWWVGELLFKFFKIYPHFKRLNQPFKRLIWQKRSQGCNVLSPLIYWKVLIKIVSIGTLVDSLTRRVGESFFDYEYLRKFEGKIGTAPNVV